MTSKHEIKKPSEANGTSATRKARLFRSRVTSAPKDQANLAFRLDGRVIERLVDVGDLVKAGQVVAKLDPQVQQNGLNTAQADLASLAAVLTQARLT